MDVRVEDPHQTAPFLCLPDRAGARSPMSASSAVASSRLIPTLMEFWQGRPSRLHDRLRYRLIPETGAWQLERLGP